MKRFVLRCEQGDYLTPTVVDVAEIGSDGPALRQACDEIARHQFEAHGDPGSDWSFSAVEAQVGDGAIWVTDVAGDRP